MEEQANRASQEGRNQNELGKTAALLFPPPDDETGLADGASDEDDDDGDDEGVQEAEASSADEAKASAAVSSQASDAAQPPSSSSPGAGSSAPSTPKRANRSSGRLDEARRLAPKPTPPQGFGVQKRSMAEPNVSTSLDLSLSASSNGNSNDDGIAVRKSAESFVSESEDSGVRASLAENEFKALSFGALSRTPGAALAYSGRPPRAPSGDKEVVPPTSGADDAEGGVQPDSTKAQISGDDDRFSREERTDDEMGSANSPRNNLGASLSRKFMQEGGWDSVV